MNIASTEIWVVSYSSLRVESDPTPVAVFSRREAAEQFTVREIGVFTDDYLIDREDTSTVYRGGDGNYDLWEVKMFKLDLAVRQ